MKRICLALITAVLAFAQLQPAVAQAQEEPQALIQRLSTDVIDTAKKDSALQAGDMSKVTTLVNEKIFPHLDFQRMTASAVGRNWRQATPEQQKRLQEEFKVLLMRTYSGALGQVKDKTIFVKPFRGQAGDNEVLVRSEVRGTQGQPVQLDYRLSKTADGWKIYDFNVLGVWLVETYRSQFAQEINAKGIDGLIATLSQRNKTNSANAGKKANAAS